MAIQVTPTDLSDLIRTQAATRAGTIALTFEGRHTTYAELDQRASRVANGLREIVPNAEARVAMLAKNTDAFHELWFGAAKARDVLVPVNWRLAPPEVAFVVNDAQAAVLFVDEAFFPVIEQILPELTTVRLVIALTGDRPGWEPYSAWRDRQHATDPGLPIAPDDVAVQFYTSGTTGHPKGVQLTHANFLAELGSADEFFPCTPEDVVLTCMPLFHLSGSIVSLFALYGGARAVIMREPVPTEILRLIPNEGVTATLFVPALILFLLQTPGCQETDFSSLRRIMYGASPIPRELLREAMATFRCEFVQVYGLTETSGVVAALSPEDHLANGGARLGSCGKPTSVAEIRVVDGAGRAAPTGDIGEIVVRSPLIMRGYWNFSEATAAANRDGWLYSGDAGYFDADGYLYVFDRVKDMIISGGENIYPAEVESALFGHPAVADVGVIGVPDERWGEAVKAIVVLKQGVQASEAELIAYCRDRIAHYKCPKSVDFADALPRNPSGKILKRVLRAPYWEGRARQVN